MYGTMMGVMHTYHTEPVFGDECARHVGTSDLSLVSAHAHWPEPAGKKLDSS
jgi:hypothetical protein